MLRKRLTYANVMSTLAVFFAMAGGTAVALDGTNTVTTDDIVDNQVTSPDVRDDSLGFGGLYQQDLGPNSVASSEIASGAVGSSEIAPFSINEGDIASHVIDNRHINPGTLNDEDISQGTFVNFLASINAVQAHNCGYNTVTGVNAAGDHLVLTPSFDASPGIINYTAEYAADGTVKIKACNPTDFNYGAHTTRFNLLVIDAQ